jgi:hypothetical protein
MQLKNDYSNLLETNRSVFANSAVERRGLKHKLYQTSYPLAKSAAASYTECLFN